MKIASTVALLLFAGFVTSGCRETCTPEEYRRGDDCVPRPDSGAAELDANPGDLPGEPEADGGDAAYVDSGDGPDIDAGSWHDATAEQADGCADHDCSDACASGNCTADPCDPNPCANGGTCSPTGTRCSCPIGFRGDRCEVDICAPNPCDHEGICIRMARGTGCDCADTGYSGSSCQLEINECASVNTCSAERRSSELAEAYPCKNEQPFYTCRGQFPDWPLGDVPNRFFASAGVVTDAKTGLTWQQAGQYDRSWTAAGSYCAELDLGGSTDWRLPTRAELESLVNYSAATKLDPIFDLAGEYWSASPFVGAPNFAWTVEFSFGSSLYRATNDAMTNDRVRCVR